MNRRLVPLLFAGVLLTLSTAAAQEDFDPAGELERAKARKEELADLAARIKEGLGKGGHGIAGFDDVLGAVTRHQVQTLLVDNDYSVPGWRCLECGWVGLTATERCPACGGATFRLEDAVGEVIRLAILQNGQVEVGEGIPLLDEMGGVAGVLRYG